MSDNERTWYYADEPSPLHEARDKANAMRAEVIEKIEALEKELGADQTCQRGGHISGFTFPEDKAPANWKHASDLNGRKVFYPKKVGTENKKLAARISSLAIPDVTNIAGMVGLSRMTIDGRYMYRTVVGWRGQRIFVGIPKVGCGDDMPNIPEWLTECPAWAKDKYMETGE